ncbi:sulfur carrier protein [Desulfoscipio geothermicus DSM 3669]|uniref:Sulfur carrier protein n=1 Tax=Desulfoscipio geothermicus DSM 3669 TaxID=1121426 RepID=A0A1I6DQP8_9FIRM|nr:sulfur carrier protein [Desulfoscipio geothermicus DSM 3669]
MQVRVKLLGILSFNYPAFSKFRPVELNEGETIEDLRKRLAVPANKVHFVSVNGKMVGEEYNLIDGDEVIFFPAASGG